MYTNEPTNQDEQRIVILDALGLSIASKRREAVAFRASSGIETEWEEDEAFYQGYDEANRNEFAKLASKPTAGGGSTEIKTAGSTVFPNITQPYVDAVAARVGDMLLPTADRNFSINETPIPDLMEVFQAEMPGMIPGQEAAAPMSAVDQMRAEFNQMKEEARRKAKKAETRIDDWLHECQYQAEVRRVIDDAAKLGSGVLKGPVPVNRKMAKMSRGEDGSAMLTMVETIAPASVRVDCWNLFPDAACGDSIHNGAYIFERDYLTEKKLEALRGLPGYIDSQIDRCIKEGPGRARDVSRTDQNIAANKDQYEIWYVHIQIKADDLMAAGCDCGDEKKAYPALITLVNDHVIRAALNPLDGGEFPYDVIPWKRRPNMPWGSGIARQIRTPQRIVVGAARRLMDNAGLASGPQMVVRRGVQPENGVWEISPLKIWVEEDDAAVQATSPISSVVVPMLQVELVNIIQLGMKLAEDVTGMPAMMQGQQGNAPDTVGGMTILNNNANAVLRRIARLFDSSITEPHIRRYYTWLMAYGEDEDEKGDYQVVALGSTALVERDIQNQEMVNVLQLCLNPAYGKNPKLAMNEYLRSRRFDPSAFDYTEAEQKAMENQPQQPAPQIAVAQIRAEADAVKTDKMLAQKSEQVQLENQTQQTRIKVDTDRDTAYIQAEMQKNRQDGEMRMAELQVKREIEILRYSTQQQISLEDAKVQLARDTMKLNTQRELAQAAGAMQSNYSPPQVATPAFEPLGRADDGRAFEQ